MSNTSSSRKRIPQLNDLSFALCVLASIANILFSINREASDQLRAMTYYLLLITHYFSPKGLVSALFLSIHPQDQILAKVSYSFLCFYNKKLKLRNFNQAKWQDNLFFFAYY